MYLEERLEAIERKQEEIISQNTVILTLLKQEREPNLTFLSTKDFAEKAAISYAVARRIIKNGVLPEPIYLKVAGQDRIHWSKFCEWLAVPGNAKKLEKI